MNIIRELNTASNMAWEPKRAAALRAAAEKCADALVAFATTPTDDNLKTVNGAWANGTRQLVEYQESRSLSTARAPIEPHHPDGAA